MVIKTLFTKTIFALLSLIVFTANAQNHYLKFESFEELQHFLSYQGMGNYLLSAHRGGPEKNFPENCIATFENTLKHTSAILEIDPRYTKDSAVIIHHDATLDRTTTGKGKVVDFTLNELKRIRLKDQEGNPTIHQIPTLNETFQWAKNKAILLLDKKDVPIEKRLEIVEQNNAESYTIIMAYNFDEAKRCYKLNKNIMMQVFINSPEKVKEFDETGVPWNNVVAFVGHQKPEFPQLTEMIHERGALCIMGTSRNLDLNFPEVSNIKTLENDYRALLKMGIDVIETDIPIPVSKILPASRKR